MWQSTTGTNSLWVMKSTTYVGSEEWDSDQPAGWSLWEVGDFDGNGVADLFWHEDAGQSRTAVWFYDYNPATDEFTRIATPIVTDLGGHPLSVPAGWQVKAAADMDGDGITDLIWRNASDTSGAANDSIWNMLATSPPTTATAWNTDTFTTVSDSTWDIVGAADFSGDGRSDIVWHNSSSCAFNVWRMLGRQLIDYSTNLSQNLCGATWVPYGP